MKRLWTYIVLSSLALSCSRQEKIPKEVLSVDKMANVLFEIGMAESRLENYTYRDTMLKRDSALKVELEVVLQIHKLSPDSFRRSYTFYKEHPAFFKEVSDTIEARAERGNERLYGRRRDFINPGMDSSRSGARQADSMMKKMRRPKLPQKP